MPCWDETSHPSESVPLCASVRNVTEEDEHVWKAVKGSKETKAKSETQIMMKEVSSGGTRFDVLEVTMHSAEDHNVRFCSAACTAACVSGLSIWRLEASRSVCVRVGDNHSLKRSVGGFLLFDAGNPQPQKRSVRRQITWEGITDAQELMPQPSVLSKLWLFVGKVPMPKGSSRSVALCTPSCAPEECP